MAWRDRLGQLAAALWWGSLTAIGFVAVPLLFASLPTPALAGQAAARLFTAQSWIGIGCGLVLLVSSRSRDGAAGMDWARGALAFVVTGMLLAVLAEFAVAPRIVARENLRLWHTLGSAMYGLQWLCALVVLWKLSDRPSSPAVPS
ncbi:DUF4149 domain-containing protein [Ramlibacter tataouinensis]|uniref:DUF4149 domain-containing protein n=1 Tax=Ramlibacter tataouinensis TaxID=94132 RepID=UPI0002DF172A|nr:DUF4149 domain-containing protein [Ramlibacter tataouinensis]